MNSIYCKKKKDLGSYLNNKKTEVKNYSWNVILSVKWNFDYGLQLKKCFRLYFAKYLQTIWIIVWFLSFDCGLQLKRCFRLYFAKKCKQILNHDFVSWFNCYSLQIFLVFHTLFFHWWLQILEHRPGCKRFLLLWRTFIDFKFIKKKLGSTLRFSWETIMSSVIPVFCCEQFLKIATFLLVFACALKKEIR